MVAFSYILAGMPRTIQVGGLHTMDIGSCLIANLVTVPSLRHLCCEAVRFFSGHRLAMQPEISQLVKTTDEKAQMPAEDIYVDEGFGRGE